MESEKAKAFLEGKVPYVVAEIGSCHLGQLEKLYELTDECIQAGADAVKVQLFPNIEKYTKANHFLCVSFLEQWITKYEDQIDLGVSVFEDAYPWQELMSKCAFIKIARSLAMNKEALAMAKKQVAFNPHLLLVGSFGYMDCFSKERFEYDVALYCHAINGQTVYPVEMEIEYSMILEATKVTGISDHSLYRGLTLGNADELKWVEKHVMLNGQLRNSCGDAAFALEMDDFKYYVKVLKGHE